MRRSPSASAGVGELRRQRRALGEVQEVLAMKQDDRKPEDTVMLNGIP